MIAMIEGNAWGDVSSHAVASNSPYASHVRMAARPPATKQCSAIADDSSFAVEKASHTSPNRSPANRRRLLEWLASSHTWPRHSFRAHCNW